MRVGSIRSRSRARRAGSGPARSSSVESELWASTGRWSTTNSAAGRSPGRPPTRLRSASTPPAEAPMTTISRPGAAVWRPIGPATAGFVPEGTRWGERPRRAFGLLLGRCGLDVDAVRAEERLGVLESLLEDAVALGERDDAVLQLSDQLTDFDRDR